jgi:anaerobic selenocysteine-containing dehydrogenase
MLLSLGSMTCWPRCQASARCWPARSTQVPSARAAHPHDAQKRGIKDGDVVRIYNSRGVSSAVVIDTMLPGVVKLDPAGAEDGAVYVHGNGQCAEA